MPTDCLPSGAFFVLVRARYLSAQTQFEAWLAMQTAGPDGLRPAEFSRRRCEFVCIHNATAGTEDTKLVDMWRQRTPNEARRVLSAPDVTVTNLSDKTTQLEKIGSLGQEAVQVYSADSCKALREAGISAAQLVDGGFTLPRLVEGGCTLAELAVELAAAGCAPAELEALGFEATDVLSAFGVGAAGCSTKQIMDGLLEACKAGKGEEVHAVKNADWTGIDATGIAKDVVDSAKDGASEALVSAILAAAKVTSIGYGAFSGCSSLAAITIPSSVTSIGDYAFKKCSSLAAITIPSSVTSIGNEAFPPTTIVTRE